MEFFPGAWPRRTSRPICFEARQSYKRSFGYTAVTYATEPPHTVLEPSTKHEEETNKGTKGNILKLTNVIEGFSSLAEIVFKEMTQANTNADTEPTREATNRRRGHRSDEQRKQRAENNDRKK